MNRRHVYPEFSGALQAKTTLHIKKQNEVAHARNANFNKVVGAMVQRDGTQKTPQAPLPEGTPVLGAHVARFPGRNDIFAAQNKADNSEALLYALDGTNWRQIVSGLPAGAEVNMTEDSDEIWVSAYDPSDNSIPYVATINEDDDASTTRHLRNAPKARFYVPYGGAMWAINVEVEIDSTTTRYPNRIYRSSGKRGAITFVRGNQSVAGGGWIKVDSVRYLKVGLGVQIYEAGTETVRNTRTISGIRKATNEVQFGATGGLNLTNRDEVCISGRKGKTTRMWNVDYPNPEAADWSEITSTFDDNDSITAVGRLSNRLFLFTETSTIKFDGLNINPIRNDVGCTAHKSIAYYDSFMIWLAPTKDIWIRNEEAGQQDVISYPIDPIMAKVPRENIDNATAVCVGHLYKLYLGVVEGRHLRVVYDFRANQFTTETFDTAFEAQFAYPFSGEVKPHFFDQNGQFWVDEEGATDDGKIIPFEVDIGDDTFQIDEKKKYIGIKVYSKNATGTRVLISVDGGDPVDIGQIQNRVESLEINDPRVRPGTMINIMFRNTSSESQLEIHKVVPFYNREEDSFRAA